MDFVAKGALFDEAGNDGEKRGEGFTASGGSENERVAPGGGVGQGGLLDGGEAIGEAGIEPLAEGLSQKGQHRAS
jgi:hypothetical protein